MRPVARLARTAAAATAAALIIAAPAAAHGNGVEVVADKLDNPRGLDLVDGKLLVTEAGRGGAGPCVPGPEMTPVCFGLSGALTVADPWGRWQKRVLDGLPSVANPAPSAPDGPPAGSGAIGPSDVSAGRRNAWMTVGYGIPSTPRDQFPEARGMGRLYKLTHHGVRDAADIYAFEAANNPEPTDIDSNPNSVDAKGKPVVVADAGGNDILAVKRGMVSLVALLPFDPAATPPVDPVPTSVVRAPDGSLYVGQLTGFPFVAGTASVFRIPPGGGTPQVAASGFTMITDIALGRDGSLYVVQFATRSLLEGPSPGALIRVKPDGTRVELAAGRLVAPTGIVLGHGAAYVSNHGAEAGAGEVLRIPLGGH